jgi:carbon starvation protein
MNMPEVTSYVHGGGSIIPGSAFPFLFITIACGAISGFHSIIATGTTPKMIASERDIPFIGYGAMLVEGFVAIMAQLQLAFFCRRTTSP